MPRKASISSPLEYIFLANTKQAKKRVRQAVRRNEHNTSMRSNLRTHVKKALAALASPDKAGASVAILEAIPVIDKMARKGIIHKNKAARYKSRLTTRAAA